MFVYYTHAFFLCLSSTHTQNTHTQTYQWNTFTGTLTCCQGLRSLYSPLLMGMCFNKRKQLWFVCMHALHLLFVCVKGLRVLWKEIFRKANVQQSVLTESHLCQWQKIRSIFLSLYNARDQTVEQWQRTKVVVTTGTGYLWGSRCASSKIFSFSPNFEILPWVGQVIS